MPRRAAASRFTEVLSTRIAINYMTTAKHCRLVIFTIDAGEFETIYLFDMTLDIGKLTDTAIKRHLLENLHRATVIHTCEHAS